MTSYKAVVEKVVHGRHGQYAVATCEAFEGSVTFGLTSPVWNETDHPEPGTFVILTDIRKKRAGWRANSGRFFQPADEPQPSNKHNSKK
jgi:hypothetical protein